MTNNSSGQTITSGASGKKLSSMKIALITDGGLVPIGNPDQIESSNATRYGKYSLKGLDRLYPDDYEVSHLGYDTTAVSRDPNRLVPLDVLRDLEKEGVIGKFAENFYATTGFDTTPENSAPMGQSMAKELKAEGVGGVIFVSSI